MGSSKVTIKTKKSPGGFAPSIEKTIRATAARLALSYAKDVQREAKKRVHVVTGALRDSIDIVKNSDTSYTVVVGKEYGVYEEYGTRYRRAHPFFRPAIEAAKARFAAQDRTINHR